jgi:hypothetical protein
MIPVSLSYVEMRRLRIISYLSIPKMGRKIIALLAKLESNYLMHDSEIEVVNLRN